MGNAIRLRAQDGFELGGYQASPQSEPRGGVIVLQEIFGVNDHIRSVCDRLAAQGYHAIAPALFDRLQPDFESGYSPPEVEHARGLMADLDWSNLTFDSIAAIQALPVAPERVAVVGFCLGGSLAYRIAADTRLVKAAVCFYGGMIVKDADRQPNCPVQMHFGESDHTIPLSDVEHIKRLRPECDVHVYPGGHGFFNDARQSFHPPSAELAWRRTLDALAAAMPNPS